MSEVTFARQFLGILDSKPQKVSSDYVADPRKLPAQSAFILPRASKPFPKQSDSTQQSASAQLNVTLSPLRKTSDSPAPVQLHAQPRTSIYDLKVQLGVQTGYSPEKLKILWERKPVTDSKTLQEVVGKESGSVDLAVMYTGVPTATPQTAGQATAVSSTTVTETATPDKMQVDETPVAQGQSGQDVLDGSQFWDDLQDFVLQRVRNEAASKEAIRLFQQAWKSRNLW